MGAVIGGLSLGVLEVMITGYVTSGYVDALIYAALFVVLLVRPQGILGKVQVRV